MGDVKEFTKLLFDDKALAILKATAAENKTAKQLAKEIKVPVSNLYYTINKLLDIEALQIKEQTQVRNMIENAYSSSHLFNADIIVNKEWLKDNFQIFLQHYLLIQKRMLDKLEQDVQTEEMFEDRVKIMLMNTRLSQDNWGNLHELITQFVQTHQSEDENDEQVEWVISVEKVK